MKFIDTHCHLDFKDFDLDREEVIKRTLDAGGGVINVGVDVATSEKVIALAHKYPNMWAIVGVHPVDNKEAVDYVKLKELAHDPKVVGIGECGFDFMHEGPDDFERQRDIFLKHIELANEVKKPLMLHVRNGKKDFTAYSQAVEILKSHAKVPFNFHFFAGSLDDMKAILEIGGTVSFTGVLTFTNDYDEVVR